MDVDAVIRSELEAAARLQASGLSRYEALRRCDGGAWTHEAGPAGSRRERPSAAAPRPTRRRPR